MKNVKFLFAVLAALMVSAVSAAKPVGVWKGNSWNRLGELVNATVFNPQWHKDKPLTVNFTGKEFDKVSAVVYLHGNNLFRFREFNKTNIAAMEKFVSNGGVLLILVDGGSDPGVSNTRLMAKLLGAKKFTRLSSVPELKDPSWKDCVAASEVFEHMLAPRANAKKSEPAVSAGSSRAINATPAKSDLANMIALTGLTTAKPIIGDASGATVTVNQLGKGKVYFVNVRLTESHTKYWQHYHDAANAAWEQYLPFAKKFHSILMSVKPALSKEKREIWDPTPLGPKASPAKITPRTPKKLVSARKYEKLNGAPLVLVANGKPQALLIARRVGERAAFDTLNNLLVKMAGASAKLPQPAPKAVGAKGDKWSWRRQAYATKIQFEVSPKVEITASGNTITISAPSPVIGIQTFMREALGYRMLWPGKDGEVYNKSTSISVAPFKLTDRSPIRQRAIRNGLSCGKYPWKTPEGKVIQINSRPGMSKGCDIIGLDVREVVKARSAHGSWAPVQRLGGTLREGGGVNFYNWQKKYGKTKPHLLALQFETVRKMKTAHVRICKSNPETIKIAVQEALVNLKRPKNKNVEYYRFSPSDGGYDIMCMCENCRKWDPTGGYVGTSRAFLGRNRPVFQYPRMTDRVLRFTCEAARELQKHKPKMKVVYLAYAGYLAPPEYYHDVPDNILVTFVGGEYLNTKQRDRDRAYWKYWSGVAKELCWRPNFLGGGSGMPLMYFREMANDLKHFASTGMVGGDFDTLPHHWATNALNYYILANLLWDPATPLEELINDFCDKGFGAASADMKRYYAYCEKLTGNYVSLGGESIKQMEDLTAVPTGGFGKFCRAFTADDFKKLEGILADARKKVGADSPELRRIDFVAAGLKYFKLNREFAMKYWKTPAKQRKTLIPEINKLVVEWKKIFAEYPFAINVPALASGYYYSFFRNCGWKPVHQFAKGEPQSSKDSGKKEKKSEPKNLQISR